jgi:hypothetical protein
MTAEQPSLSSLIGQRISIKIPLWKQNAIMSVSLVGVETGGICWNVKGGSGIDPRAPTLSCFRADICASLMRKSA